MGQGPTELWTAGLGRQGGPAHRNDVLPPEAGALHPGSPGDAQGAGWAGQGAGAEADPEPRQEAALGNPFCPEPMAVTGTERAAAGRGVTEWTPRSAVASHGRSRHGSVLRCLQRARRLVLRRGPWNPRGRGVAPAGRGAQEGPPGWRAPRPRLDHLQGTARPSGEGGRRRAVKARLRPTTALSDQTVRGGWVPRSGLSKAGVRTTSGAASSHPLPSPSSRAGGGRSAACRAPDWRALSASPPSRPRGQGLGRPCGPRGPARSRGRRHGR